MKSERGLCVPILQRVSTHDKGDQHAFKLDSGNETDRERSVVDR